MDLRLPNTLTLATVSSLYEAVAAASEPIVMRGTCLGLDLGDLEAAAEVLPVFDRLLDLLLYGPQPVLALVEGSALGGALGLVSVADVVIALPTARLGLPEALIGLTPATVMPYVERRVGPAQARRLALSGRSMEAGEAAHIGLVDVVSTDLEAESARVLKRWSRADPASLAAIRARPREPRWSTVQDLLQRPETRTRIAAFQNGEAPWS